MGTFLLLKYIKHLWGRGYACMKTPKIILTCHMTEVWIFLTIVTHLGLHLDYIHRLFLGLSPTFRPIFADHVQGDFKK